MKKKYIYIYTSSIHTGRESPHRPAIWGTCQPVFVEWRFRKTKPMLYMLAARDYCYSISPDRQVKAYTFVNILIVPLNNAQYVASCVFLVVYLVLTGKTKPRKGRRRSFHNERHNTLTSLVKIDSYQDRVRYHKPASRNLGWPSQCPRSPRAAAAAGNRTPRARGEPPPPPQAWPPLPVPSPAALRPVPSTPKFVNTGGGGSSSTYDKSEKRSITPRIHKKIYICFRFGNPRQNLANKFPSTHI